MFERWTTGRKLAHIAPLRPDSMEGEVVRVTGVVGVASEILVAPFCERECVAWRLRFRIGGGQYDGTTSGTFETFELRAFTLETVLHRRIAVRGEACVIEVPSAAPLLTRTGEPWRAFCEERGLALVDRQAGIDEAIVEPDTRITVAGILVGEPAPPSDAELGYRDGAPPRLHLAGTFEHPLLIGAAVD